MSKFVASIVKICESNDSLEDLPDIALIGPSNSGKSTIINSLAKSTIALTSNKPGKTCTLNYYDFDNFYLVDTPGYGFAIGSKSKKMFLRGLLDDYFTSGRSVLGVFQVTSTHALSDKDLEVLKYLKSRFDNYTLILNKMDKLSKNQQLNLLNGILKTTGLDIESVVLISAKKSLNIQAVKSKIKDYLS